MSVSFYIIIYFRVYFCCVNKIILRTCNGEKTVVRIYMYVKQEPESCSSVKNYPSVKTEMVFSNGLRQALYFSASTIGKLSSDHFEAAAKRRNKNELARD